MKGVIVVFALWVLAFLAFHFLASVAHAQPCRLPYPVFPAPTDTCTGTTAVQCATCPDAACSDCLAPGVCHLALAPNTLSFGTDAAIAPGKPVPQGCPVTMVTTASLPVRLQALNQDTGAWVSIVRPPDPVPTRTPKPTITPGGPTLTATPTNLTPSRTPTASLTPWPTSCYVLTPTVTVGP